MTSAAIRNGSVAPRDLNKRTRVLLYSGGAKGDTGLNGAAGVNGANGARTAQTEPTESTA